MDVCRLGLRVQDLLGCLAGLYMHLDLGLGKGLEGLYGYRKMFLRVLGSGVWVYRDQLPSLTGSFQKYGTQI